MARLDPGIVQTAVVGLAARAALHVLGEDDEEHGQRKRQPCCVLRVKTRIPLRRSGCKRCPRFAELKKGKTSLERVSTLFQRPRGFILQG